MTKKAIMYKVEHMSLWHNWVSCGYIHQSGIYGSWGRLFPNFQGNHSHDIQRGCTSLQSYQQCRNFPLSPQSLQHMLSSVFLILALLTGVKWTLRVVLICISLMTMDVEYFFKCLSAILDPSVDSSLFRSVLNFLFDYVIFGVQYLEFFVYFGVQTSVWCGGNEDLFLFCSLLFLRPLIHKDLSFVRGDRYGSIFIPLNVDIQLCQHHLLNMLSFLHLILFCFFIKD